MNRKRAVIVLTAIAATFVIFAGGWTLATRLAPDSYTISTERGTVYSVPDAPAPYGKYDEFTPVNINTADVDELMSLPSIGEVRAAAIIAYREQNGGFSAPEDIMEVSGIGEGIYRQLQGLITVEDVPPGISMKGVLRYESSGC